MTANTQSPHHHGFQQGPEIKNICSQWCNKITIPQKLGYITFDLADRTIDLGFSCSGESGVADSVETLGRNFLPVLDILNVTPMMSSHQEDRISKPSGSLQQNTNLNEIETFISSIFQRGS